jgi:hypothetical protein
MFWLSDDKPWFRPKRFGLGAGMPISWQGWVLVALHSLLLFGIGVALRGKPLAMVAAIIPAALLPLPIYAGKTRGGWRWRWGGDE